MNPGEVQFDSWVDCIHDVILCNFGVRDVYLTNSGIWVSFLVEYKVWVYWNM